MDNIKAAISENKVFIIILIVIVAIFLTNFIIDYIEGKEIYQSPIPKDIPLIEKKYNDNEYKVMIIDEVDIINLYYKNYLNEMINNPKSAWEKTFKNGENSSTNFQNKYEEYSNLLKKRITKFTNGNIVKKYNFTKKSDYNLITVVDSENYKYEFYEYGVWDYKVAFKGQVDSK